MQLQRSKTASKRPFWTGPARTSGLLISAAAIFLAAQVASSQVVGINGATIGDRGAASRSPSPSPADARLLSPEQFQHSEVETRRRVMLAWAYGSPEKAGTALLPLLDIGLRDADQDVRWHAMQALLHVETVANLARFAHPKSPIITDPRSHPALSKTLWNLLADPNPSWRRNVVRALTFYEIPPTEAFTAEFLNLLSTERHPSVRAAIVGGLANSAKDGSVGALRAVMAALDESDAQVQLSAVTAMGVLRVPEALPRLIQLMSRAQSPSMRMAIVRTLTAYRVMAEPEVAMLRSQLTLETDREIRKKLQDLITSLEHGGAALRN